MGFACLLGVGVGVQECLGLGLCWQPAHTNTCSGNCHCPQRWHCRTPSTLPLPQNHIPKMQTGTQGDRAGLASQQAGHQWPRARIAACCPRGAGAAFQTWDRLCAASSRRLSEVSDKQSRCISHLGSQASLLHVCLYLATLLFEQPKSAYGQVTLGADAAALAIWKASVTQMDKSQPQQ